MSKNNDIVFLMLAMDYADRFVMTYTYQVGFYERGYEVAWCGYVANLDFIIFGLKYNLSH